MRFKGDILMPIKEIGLCNVLIRKLFLARYKLHQIHCGGGESQPVEALTEPDWSCEGQCGLTSTNCFSSSSTDGEGSRSQMRGRVRRALAAWRSSVRPRRILPENIWTFGEIFDINFYRGTNTEWSLISLLDMIVVWL